MYRFYWLWMSFSVWTVCQAGRDIIISVTFNSDLGVVLSFQMSWQFFWTWCDIIDHCFIVKLKIAPYTKQNKVIIELLLVMIASDLLLSAERKIPFRTIHVCKKESIRTCKRYTAMDILREGSCSSSNAQTIHFWHLFHDAMRFLVSLSLLQHFLC